MNKCKHGLIMNPNDTTKFPPGKRFKDYLLWN